MNKARQIFENLLAPQSYDKFVEEVFGQRPLLVGDGDKEARLALFPDIRDTLLDHYGRLAPSLWSHSGAATLPAPGARVTTSRAQFEDLINQHHSGGHTVRLSDVGDLSPGLHQFTRALEALFLAPVDVVIFWSTHGLTSPIHLDRHEIIAIQLVGEKRWAVSKEPPQLVNPWNSPGEPPPPLDDPHIWDVAPGDLLYIPRGTPHAVSSPTESIHLSIGFAPWTVRDATAAALDFLSDLNRPLRMGVVDRADDISSAPDMAEIQRRVGESIEALGKAVASPEFLRDALEYRHSRMIGSLPPLPTPVNAAAISAATTLRHADLALGHVLNVSNSVVFALPGEHIKLHGGAEPAIRFIKDTPEFRVADIPGGLAEEVQVALAQRLVTLGFLIPVSG